MTLLEVSSVSRTFGALRAVDDVSFEVDGGEIFGIAGPNGSGKSTLFNILTKIPFGPSTGEVRFAGTPLNTRRAHAIARMGLVRTFQRETCFESLSLFENVMISLSASRGQLTRRDAAAEALVTMGFAEAEFAKPSLMLTVYERKRLMMASAIASRPRMVLLDEPVSGLTKPEIDESIGYVRRIAEQGIAILLIEHVLPFLMTLSQRVMVLNNGSIIGMGDPHGVMREPAVVEAYLGTRTATQ